MPSDMVADFGTIGRTAHDDRAAFRTVCRNATDGDDALDRLQQLGLIPYVRPPKPLPPVVVVERCARCQRPMVRQKVAPEGFVRHSSHGTCNSCGVRAPRSPGYRANDAARTRERRARRALEATA